jgi:hypothetical protein
LPNKSDPLFQQIDYKHEAPAIESVFRANTHLLARRACLSASSKFQADFPANSLSGPVATETNRFAKALSIQALDGVVQSPFRANALALRQGIIDPIRPILLVKRGQNQFLVFRRPIESFYDLAIESKNTFSCVPTWNR